MKRAIVKNIAKISELDLLIDEVMPLLKESINIGLCGSLGAGKTTFVKHILRKLASKDEVTSPTYVLQHEYNTDLGLVEHWDLYRLSQYPPEIYDNNPAVILRFIEWVDKFPEIQGILGCIINIDVDENGLRTFSFYVKN